MLLQSAASGDDNWRTFLQNGFDGLCVPAGHGPGPSAWLSCIGEISFVIRLPTPVLSLIFLSRSGYTKSSWGFELLYYSQHAGLISE